MSFAMFEGLESIMNNANDPFARAEAAKFTLSDGSPNWKELYFALVQGQINMVNHWGKLSAENALGKITNEKVIDSMDDFVLRQIPALAIIEEHMIAMRENRAPDLRKALSKVFGF